MTTQRLLPLKYFFTVQQLALSIVFFKQGLIPNSRQYVHLSQDYKTAVNVGNRHGKSIVLSVDSGKMFSEGFEFYQADNGVWLTRSVPVKYLRIDEKE
nr:RNA 2'-phosphotransferase [Shigella sp. FC1967]